MIDKQEFYHGAALIRVIDDRRCRSITKSDLGFVVNGNAFIYLKYRTKGRTPWQFQFGNDEVMYLNSMADKYPRILIAFICGGDGICGVTWLQAAELLANGPGWISCARKFREQYGVTGTNGKVQGKVPLQHWPALIFET